jgi:hypothetical protein
MAGANTRLPPSGTFQYCSDPFNKQALGKPLPSLTLFTAVDEQVSLWYVQPGRGLWSSCVLDLRKPFHIILSNQSHIYFPTMPHIEYIAVQLKNSFTLCISFVIITLQIKMAHKG